MDQPGAPTLKFVFEEHPSAPGAARRQLHSVLDGVPEPVADNVTLVVSELVSNVVQHATGGGVLRAWIAAGSPIRIEVADRSASRPIVARNDPFSTGGRGLQILDLLAASWGVAATRLGKVVWAEFDRDAHR